MERKCEGPKIKWDWNPKFLTPQWSQDGPGVFANLVTQGFGFFKEAMDRKKNYGNGKSKQLELRPPT